MGKLRKFEEVVVYTEGPNHKDEILHSGFTLWNINAIYDLVILLDNITINYNLNLMEALDSIHKNITNTDGTYKYTRGLYKERIIDTRLFEEVKTKIDDVIQALNKTCTIYSDDLKLIDRVNDITIHTYGIELILKYTRKETDEEYEVRLKDQENDRQSKLEQYYKLQKELGFEDKG